MSKLMHEAKHQIKGLERIDSSHVEASKRLEDKVGTQLKALDAELKDLSDELRLAQISKREDEEKLRSIRKFSTVDVKVESISLARRASQVEKLDLESAISCMERRSEDSTSPMSPTEIEILSMKQKMATILEEKLMISDELIESRTSLSNLESLLQSRSLENEKMEKELTEKEKRISLTENSLKEAQIETTNLKEELVAAKDDISSREREDIAQLEGKAKDRPHRVELNFTPNIQPALEQKVENLKEELLAVRRNSVTQANQVIPASRGVDKGIQVGDEPRKLERHRSWESPRSVRRSFSLDQTDVCESPRSVRRRMSLDQTTYGHAKVERKFSRTEVKLVQRAEKGVQVEIIEQLGTTTENSREDEVSRETLSKENQELKTILEQHHREIASLEHEVKKLQRNKNDSSCDGEDNAPFNYPKRVSELWTSLEEARQEKAEGDKRNKELQDELEKQEQEIQVIIKNLKHPGTERESEIIHTSRTDILTQNNNYLKENELVITEQSRTLQELVSSSERNYLDHEFVFDSQDGRCIPSEPRLEVAADKYKSDETIPRLEMVIDRLRKELTALETQSRELETELYRKEEDLRKAGSELEFYKTKLSEQKDYLDETSDEKGELVQYKTQVSDLNALLEETRIEKRRAEEESERYKTQISELRVSLDQTRKDNSNIELYKSQISHLKSSLDKTKRENEISATEILQCNSQIRDLKTSLEDARKGFHRTEKEISMYKSEITELKTSLNEISERSKSRISELKASLDDSKKELSSAKKEIELYKSEIFELKSRLTKTERENRNAIDEREQYKSQISSLEASLEETKRENVSAGEEVKKNKSEILELKSSLDERRRENELATGEIQRYKSQIRDMKVSLEDVKRENGWNLKEIDRYKHEMSDLKISLGRSKKESANVTKEYELYKFEISDLQTSLEEERKENRAAAKTIERYKSEISDLKSSLEKAKEENRTAALEIERFKSQITDLQASLEGKRKESLSAANKTEKCQREISDLKSSVFKAKEEIRTATNDIERYKKQIFDLQAALEGERKENQAAASKIEKRESDISNLKSSLDKAREDNRSLENGIERFKKQISDLQASLEGERNENLATTKKIHKCESEIFELRNSFDKKNEETFNVTSDIESYKTQISNLQATLENTIKDNRRRESKNDELQRELNKMEETVQENKMKEAEIRLEKGRLETGNSKLQITIDNLKNQLMRTDKKMKDLELRAEEDNKTISQLMDEQSGIGRLQQQVKVLETKLSVRDKNLEQKVDEIIERDQRIEQLAREKEELMKKVEEISSQREEKPVYFDTIDGASKGDVLENEVVPTFNQQLQSPREQDELVKNVDKISSKRQEKPTYFDTIDETTESAILGNEVVRNFNEQLQSRREQDELVKKVEEISSKREEKPAYFDSIDRASQTDVLGNEVVRDFNQQLQSPQTALKGIHQEKAYLEDTVLQLTNVKNSQDKELDLLRQQIQLLESSVQDTERSLETNVQQMVMKEKELRELVNEKVVKTSQIESLESSLSMALRDRDSTLAAKDDSIERLQEERRALEIEVAQLTMDVQKQVLDWQQKSKMEAELQGVADKLKETELKYLLTKEEKGKVEKDLKNTTERLIMLQKGLSDAQGTIKVKEAKIKQLSADNFDLRAMVKDKDESSYREEKLRMENMKSLDALKIKLEKMGVDDKRQRERLFSLKSACSEANEAYEIVKKQNHEMKRDMEDVKKRLSEKDSVLEITEKEKEQMEEQILNASRTIDDLRKSSRRDESVSPDSALGISLTSAFEFSSGPNSPNSVASDNAFSGDGFGQETGLLCKMPTMIENFRAVVRDNEVLRGKLFEVAVQKEKQESQLKHLTQLNEILKNDVSGKEKSVLGLEDKVKILEGDTRDAKNKVVELERNFAVVSAQADLLKTSLENREEDFADLQERIEIQEEKEKTLELYSKSVAEKFEYESGEKKKYEGLSRQLLEESTLQKNKLQNIEKKLSASPSDRDSIYFSAQGGVPMATVEDKVDIVLKNKKDLEVLVSNLQAECADLQLANGDLQKDLSHYLESEKLRQELEGELKATRIRDEQASAKVVKLDEQKKSLQNENKSLDAAISECKKKEEKLEIKAGAMKQTISELEKANENFHAQNENLKDDLRRADDESSKLASELKSFQAKMAEIEITNDAFHAENEKLRTDIMALSEAKCDVELTISETERQIKKLKESADKERMNREILAVQKNEALNHCEELQSELNGAKNHISTMEGKQKEAEQSIEVMEKSKFDSSSENRRLGDELKLVKKDLSEMEGRYKNSIQEEENLQQKLNLASLEMAKLTTAHEGSVKRNDAMERSLIESKGKNEELEILLEKTRLEKANVLRDVSQKDEVIQQLEAKKHELEEERQSLTNDLYIATRKVLAQQQNAETLMNEINHMNREMKGTIKNALNKEGRTTEEEKTSQGDGDTVVSENEVLMQNLRQSIRATERNLDFFRSEAKVPEHETKSCQRDVEFINKEFSLLRNQLSSFSATSHKLCEDIKKLKEDLAQKESLLEETKEQHNNLKEENLENRESIIQLQNKCTELEALFGEYENKAEKQHAELVRTNQQISTLDSNLLRSEQKKTALEKELLVCHEKISYLEANARAMKDEGRSDKKKIATLETEYNEKQTLARELDNTEATLRELRGKLDDVLKEKEEAKTELYGMREELRQQQVELKNARKEVDHLKKQMNSEKDTRQKVELDLNENTAVCKTYKSNLQDLERSLARLREENSDLEEKVGILDTTGNALRKETELQAIEMRRLEEELADTKEQYSSLCRNHEGSEKDRKKLVNEMIAADERITKLQGTCDELLKEKETSSSKVFIA
ncbi:hypothetical protein OS493_011357 [Desmophyllum pertusum]|uniref:Uncharacterized protein n=1 Tax=Desmophyllum pertusum TaxID=174260 RepID=A0A9W9Z4R8_9CNID|nr:hypothetical protein OS493_011357 [Desmophyllum pertusum]